MNKQQRKNNLNKGEASIVFTFVILMIVLMGAFTISIISISTIKGARTGQDSAQALYMADTGLEQATSEYWWAGGDAGAGACASNGQISPVELVIDDEGDGTGGCPSIEETNDPAGKKLCIEAIGRSGSTERKLTSESGQNSAAACVFK